MMVVPGSHARPILCTEKADTRLSFTDVAVPLPEQLRRVPVRMQPGDVLFFNGSLVHGSMPNRTVDRFRRSLIGHYSNADARRVAAYYHPPRTAHGRQHARAGRRRGWRRVWRVDGTRRRAGDRHDRDGAGQAQARVVR